MGMFNLFLSPLGVPLSLFMPLLSTERIPVPTRIEWNGMLFDRVDYCVRCVCSVHSVHGKREIIRKQQRIEDVPVSELVCSAPTWNAYLICLVWKESVVTRKRRHGHIWWCMEIIWCHEYQLPSSSKVNCELNDAKRAHTNGMIRRRMMP